MLRWMLLIAFLLGCSPYEADYRRPSVTSSSLLEQRLEVLDKKYGDSELCEDYLLAMRLISTIQNSEAAPKTSDTCPQGFKNFSRALYEAVIDLEDLHTDVIFGNGIDANLYPVIQSCTGGTLCKSLPGAIVQPIAGSAEDAFFAASFTAPNSIVLWELLDVDGKDIASYKSEMDKDRVYSHSRSNWASQLPDYLLKRRTSDRSRLTDLTIRVRDLATGDILKLKTSYDAPQTIFGSKDILDLVSNMNLDRAYGCDEVMDGSSIIAGACRTAEGKTVVWIGEWPNLDDFKPWTTKLAAWLKPSDQAIKLDIRGNSGGNPLAVTQFLCEFGDDASLDVVDQESLDIRYWPRSFTILDSVFKTADLEKIDNLPLVRIMDVDSVDASPAIAKSFSESLWERAGIDRSTCEGMRRSDFQEQHWDILTDGNEFSSTEDFLFIARIAKEKFTIYGKTSLGGSGNPTWITLPRTRTGIRLSPGRTVYDSKVVIEGKGVAPHIAIDAQETAEEFAARLKTVTKDLKLIDFKADHRSDALRKAFFEKN